MTMVAESGDLTVAPEAAPQLDAASDSIAVAAWTLVSRITGVAKIAAIGAVLGPTFLGNTFQLTNSLPNLIYFGLLAGSLFSSLLVPALVEHIDAEDQGASERIAGGLLGMTLLALVVATPLAIALGPMVLRVASFGGPDGVGAAQANLGQLLILMFVPQLFLYAVVGTASAAMNAHRRFALAAAAPAVENIGLLTVLATSAVIFPARTRIDQVPTGMLLLLGLGSTGAVALHAALQWWGARRAGVTLLPRSGWRDPDVLVVVRRALPSLAQAGLVAVQVLVMLALANRVPGGVTALQISLNFYFLAIALGTTPVALSLLPRLARLSARGAAAEFSDTFVRGISLGFFVAIPAAVGCVTLAWPVAHAVSIGRMNTPAGVAMVAGSMAALAVAIVAQNVFMIATYASYARLDTRSPLHAMVLQAVTCLSLAGFALLAHGSAVLVILGSAFSVSIVVAAVHLTVHLRINLVRGSARLASSAVKIGLGAAFMAGPAALTAMAVTFWVGRPLGSGLAVIAATVVGVAAFVAAETALRAPELAWLSGGAGLLRVKAIGALRARHG
ncbi:MAG: putative peptidoglycan lipid flippase [Pseudonocardiales bacterium]|nr:putative peptidoglycan lipid flippase [Pseudonocardiales bacterium]